MADYFLIKGETLEAMGNKVREVLGVGKYSFKEEVGADGVFNADAVTVYYKEYVDYDGQDYGLSPDVYEGDVFIAYDFIEDNNGVITPVIYKTDINGDESETPDYQDKHFYVGQATIEGVIYDKWRKIEDGSQDFDWGSVSKKYLYTNIIVASNTFSPTVLPEKIEKVYNAGYLANGSGNSTVLIKEFAPLIIQGRNLPVDASNYSSGDVMYNSSLFESTQITSSNGGAYTYNYSDDLEYSAESYGDEFEISFTNLNPNYSIKVYFKVEVTYYDSGSQTTQSETLYEGLTLQPSGRINEHIISPEYAVGNVFDLRGSMTIEGLKYS